MKNQTQDQSLAVTDTSFQEEVLQSDIPVLVDFWAEWCGPCRIVGPTVDALAAEYQGRIKVVKLNVDDNPDTANGFGIRSIPTLILFKDGEVQAQKLGAMSKSQLTEFLDTNL